MGTNYTLTSSENLQQETDMCVVLEVTGNMKNYSVLIFGIQHSGFERDIERHSDIHVHHFLHIGSSS
jgi:hypothetical protein